MDRARQKTDSILNGLERRVKSVYDRSPSLRNIRKKYERYMKKVSKATHEAYLAYKNAPLGDERAELKKAYGDAVRSLTLDNKQYNDIVNEFTDIMAKVNQQALDLINAETDEIYAMNYNQVAVDCRKVGITVEDNNG